MGTLTEGNLKFTFTSDKAIKFDDKAFYKSRYNQLPGSKGVDFIFDSDNALLFLEVKDCLGYEAENNWRIAPDNQKRDTILSCTDKSDRESLDIEVSLKVAHTISCLLGAQTYGEFFSENAGELIPFAKALENHRIPNGKKSLLVVLFLEGNFSCSTRDKKMIMSRIQTSLKRKLKWLNCRVSVEDLNTCRGKFFHVERISNKP